MCPNATLAAPTSPLAAWLASPDFSAFVSDKMAADQVPGVSVAVIDHGQVIFRAGMGWANIADRRPMASGTIINIASVTKTITATAVMQLFEQDKFKLDDDVNAFLPFSVRNPAYPSTPISFRQLLVHTSSIDDGPSYGESYVCGDAQPTLARWLSDYLVQGGAHFDIESNFHKWAPGTTYSYSNIAYGLLGLLVEKISCIKYAEYCERKIFTPLGMTRTRFHLKGMDRTSHAIPYSFTKPSGFAPSSLKAPSWGRLVSDDAEQQLPYCLYSYPTIADGSAGSTATDLGKFLAMCAGGGTLQGARILRSDTMALMLSDQGAPTSPGNGQHQGLGWVEYSNEIWGKYGGDPGIATLAKFRLTDGRGIVSLTNSDRGESFNNAIAKRVFEFAE